MPNDQDKKPQTGLDKTENTAQQANGDAPKKRGPGRPKGSGQSRPRKAQPAKEQQVKEQPAKEQDTQQAAEPPKLRQTRSRSTQKAAGTQKPAGTQKAAGTQAKSAGAAKSTGAAKTAAATKGAANKNAAAKPAAKPTAASKETAVATETATEKKTQTRTQTNRRRTKNSAGKKNTVRIIPLGGLGEVGKNLTVYECQNDAFIVDCGLTFPDESMPGVDLVIPDFTYILENKDRIKGIAITHGHEDHIGGIAFLLKKFNLPLYGTRLTLGLIEGKLKEHGLAGKVKMHVMKPRDVVKFGCMSVEFIKVNHSIPDACAFAIHTPAGVIVQTGDFKVDFTPIDGEIIDLARFGELGSHGVLALLSDSTNAERPGSTASERIVGDSFDKLFSQAVDKRILVATFASNVHRLQQIMDAAAKYKRKVAVSGRSMENVVGKALELGYLKVPKGLLIEVDAVNKFPGNKVVIITTGSQGEPMSALTRMAMGDHRKVTVTPQDCIIISATPIPGNEKLVTKVVNELMKLGAQVVYEKMYDVHVSGHACQDELKMIIALTKPKFFVPMHGEFKHLKKHAELAIAMGIDPKRVLVGDIGRVMETDGETMRFNGTVPAGKVLVDGLGVGDVGSIVLRDRKHLAQDGLIIVVTTIDTQTGQILAGPDIVSRGFVYVRESEGMIDKARDIARDCIQECMDNNTREWGVLKQRVKDDVGDYLWQMTKRNPMILPVIQEI